MLWLSRLRSRATVATAMAVLMAGCAAAPATGSPSFGIAVAEDGGTWCAVFDPSQRLPGPDDITLVSMGSAGPLVRTGVLGPRRSDGCHVPFAQSGWHDYVAFDLILASDDRAGAWPDAAALVTSRAAWAVDEDGVLRSDIDYDGRPETLTACLAGEGMHWTVWQAGDSTAGRRVRRWHGYYDLGAAVDTTCRPGEDGSS